MTEIEEQGRVIDKDISIDSVFKSLAQIEDIQQGVKDWQNWLNERADRFCQQFGKHQKITKKWLIECVVPLAYWLNFYRRIPAKKKNKRLRKQYEQLISKARGKLENSKLNLELPPTEKQQC